MINNAAVFGVRNRVLANEGHELHFTLNYLSQFTLTHLLLDKLASGAPARIINVASEAYRMADFDLGELRGDKPYDYRRQYGFSKLCVILFTRELAKRLGDTSVMVNCLNPGLVFTGIGKNAGLIYNLRLRWKGRKYAKSPEEAAKTYIFLAASAEAGSVSGKYFYDEAESPLNDMASCERNARELWDYSVKITGIDNRLTRMCEPLVVAR